MFFKHALVSDRTESKFEVITYSVELHDMLIELMQRSFGVKDLDRLVRMKYAYGKDTTEDFSRYRYLMLNYKNRIDQLASMLTSNIRAANSIYPTTLHEYEQRRDLIGLYEDLFEKSIEIVNKKMIIVDKTR